MTAKGMNLRFEGKTAVLLLSLVAVSLHAQTPSDSSITLLGVSVGHGAFGVVTHEKETGRVINVDYHHFVELSAELTHAFPTLVYCGVAGGAISRTRSQLQINNRPPTSRTIWYITPNVGINTKYVGVDLGYLFIANPVSAMVDYKRGFPSAMLRIGNFDAPHFAMSFAHNHPLMSGGGLFDIGVEFPIDGGGKGWCGMGFFPFDSKMFTIKAEGPMNGYILDFSLQVGGGNTVEYGLAVGAKLVID